jgi:hypothetical protein
MSQTTDEALNEGEDSSSQPEKTTADHDPPALERTEDNTAESKRETLRHHPRLAGADLLAGRRLWFAAAAAVIAVATAGAVLAIRTASDAGGKFSGKPADYMPAQVDGKTVRTNTPLTTELAKTLSVRGKNVAAGEAGKISIPLPEGATGTTGATAPPGTDDLTLPEVVLYAGNVAENETLDESAELLAGGLPGGQRSVKERTIQGTQVKVLDYSKSEIGIVLVLAKPRPDLFAAAFTFSGGPKMAEKAMNAMLAAGKV